TVLVDCASGEFPNSDLNHDGVVDNLDFDLLSTLWLNDCYEKSCYNIDIKEDGLIDLFDFAHFSDSWQVIDYNSYQIAHWTFDEGSGSIAYDSTLNGHDGDLTSMYSSWTSGKRAGALYFDGINDYVSIYEVSNGLGQYFERDFSIALWVNQYSPQTDYEVIIGIESTSRFEASGFEGFTIETYYGVPAIYIAYADTEREIIPASVSLNLDNWQHLCVVREGSSVRIYLDGKLDTSEVITGADIKFGSAWPGYDVIGATKDSFFGRTGGFHGKLDDIHLYNFAIPESLIHKLAQQDYAWLPEPEDDSSTVSSDTCLTWQKGTWAGDYNCHDVFLGTDYGQVLNADTSAPQIYKARQTSCLFDPGGLDSDTLYFWRVDDVNGTQTHTGSVWSFTTTDLIASIEASSSQIGFDPYGAYDNYRFEETTGKCWKGQPDQGSWYWQLNFTEPRQIGSILMIMSEHESIQENTPTDYKWQYSNNGTTWYDLTETIVVGEKRLFRIQRLDTAVTVEHLRIQISGCVGTYPTIREVELYDETDANIPFDDWLIAVNITEYPELPGVSNTDWFIDVARDCSGWSDVQGQQIWLPNFDESFLNIEPYPLCVFLSGSYYEWCQRTQSYFAGLQEVVINENIPIWGSCGGAQVLGLLIEPGYRNPWDCPRCRYGHSPAWSPIYGHIGYYDPGIEPQSCGNYDNCIGESGAYWISKVTSDPVFAGLSNPFRVLESHIGQLEYLPSGWHQIGGPGPGTLTELQCFRKTDKYIYGAQFHIENDHTSETNSNARKIMANFLSLAQLAGGYQPLL
ncbi:MAG: discoidin domain-containing protein, partial [Phycisphaerales bacterium]